MIYKKTFEILRVKHSFEFSYKYTNNTSFVNYLVVKLMFKAFMGCDIRNESKEIPIKIEYRAFKYSNVS